MDLIEIDTDRDDALEWIRTALLSIQAKHKPTCPDGPDCRWVGGVLAYFAHCLGANAEDLATMRTQLVQYDLRCRQNGGCDVHGEVKT